MKELPGLLTDLNPEQKEAVTWAQGPLLILAGAGSPNRSIDRIDIMSTGEIIVNRNNADAWVSLDGICFSTLP